MTTKPPLIYLTYGDVDSPVYRTQVIGFCDFVKESLAIDTQIVAFVPLRMFLSQRKILKAYEKGIKVYPVINRFQSNPWYSAVNAFFIRRLRPASIMTRNPAAIHVCAEIQKEEIPFFYDARGCQYKEMEEFSEADQGSVKTMMNQETACFKQADWVFSVSKELITYFKDNHRYNDHNHSIIPCCVLPEGSLVPKTKQELYGREDVKVFCYAGALSVWNYPKSFHELCRLILKDDRNRLIILSHELEKIEGDKLFQNDRVILKKASSIEVSSYLQCVDHAILLRKSAVTNRVASPSKFGEYLMAGCQVIISPEIGDFSEMVTKNGLGIEFRGKKDRNLLSLLEITSDLDRERVKRFARSHFIRTSDLNMIRYRNLKKLHDGH